MSKKNQKRKKEMKEQQGCPRPWRQIDDTVVDAHGRIVKAPHGCSWEGDNYNDGAPAAQIIVEAVNNSQQPQPVPEWQPIETAPKDGSTIIAWCEHEENSYFEGEGERLTAYGGNAEGMSHADDGVNLVYWHDEIDEGEYTIPAWWCVADDRGEIAANPTHWMPLPAAPKPGGD